MCYGPILGQLFETIHSIDDTRSKIVFSVHRTAEHDRNLWFFSIFPGNQKKKKKENHRKTSSFWKKGIGRTHEQIDALSFGRCDSGCPDCGCRRTNYFDNGEVKIYAAPNAASILAGNQASGINTRLLSTT